MGEQKWQSLPLGWKGEITETKLLFILMVSNTGEIWFLFLSGERGQERYLALKDSITLKGLAQRGQENVCVCLCVCVCGRDNLRKREWQCAVEVIFSKKN